MKILSNNIANNLNIHNLNNNISKTEDSSILNNQIKKIRGDNESILLPYLPHKLTEVSVSNKKIENVKEDSKGENLDKFEEQKNRKHFLFLVKQLNGYKC